MAISSTYNAFTSEKVFTNEEINIFSNKLFVALYEKFKTIITVEERFVLTGKAASIIQGATLIELLTVSFITDDLDIYLFLAENLFELFPDYKTQVYSQSIQIEALDVNIEIWRTDDIVDITVVNDIYCQTSANIPSYIENYGL